MINQIKNLEDYKSNSTASYRTPVMAGGLFAINKNFFYQVSKFILIILSIKTIKLNLFYRLEVMMKKWKSGVVKILSCHFGSGCVVDQLKLHHGNSL